MFQKPCLPDRVLLILPPVKLVDMVLVSSMCPQCVLKRSVGSMSYYLQVFQTIAERLKSKDQTMHAYAMERKLDVLFRCPPINRTPLNSF